MVYPTNEQLDLAAQGTAACTGCCSARVGAGGLTQMLHDQGCNRDSMILSRMRSWQLRCFPKHDETKKGWKSIYNARDASSVCSGCCYRCGRAMVVGAKNCMGYVQCSAIETRHSDCMTAGAFRSTREHWVITGGPQCITRALGLVVYRN